MGLRGNFPVRCVPRFNQSVSLRCGIFGGEDLLKEVISINNYSGGKLPGKWSLVKCRVRRVESHLICVLKRTTFAKPSETNLPQNSK